MKAKLRLTGLLILALLLAGAASAAEPAAPETGREYKYPAAVAAADGGSVAGEDRQAAAVMVKVFAAYNAKKPDQIKKVDWRYRDMADDEVAAKFAQVEGFALHDIRLGAAAADTLVAEALYSFKAANDPAVYYSITGVVLLCRDGIWGVAETMPLPEKTAADLAKQAQAAEKRFGVADLSQWSGLPQ